jgi:catechol 2,3-dioxygenase-like lactoylglutathione lyase family enzyme
LVHRACNGGREIHRVVHGRVNSLWDRRLVAMEVLFVGLAVRRFSEAVAWYERLFGRPPDIVPVPEHEVMWRVTDGGWLYVVVDPDRAGKGLTAIAVNSIEATIAELKDRNVEAGPIRPEGDGARKAIVEDLDGNTIALIQVR